MYSRFFKRFLDFILSLTALIVLFPILLILTVIGAFAMKGNPFFVQPRPGKKGKNGKERIFKLIKLRTMSNAKDKEGNLLPDEVRLNKYGRFLRSTSLDELPELLNILKGDMSVVGPRPERKVLADEICKEVPEFDYRLKVRGGLTGYAQIYGKYNTSSYDKLRLDLMYIENYSLLLDIKLIILTLRIIFSKDSTEGIDVAAENQKKAEALLQEAEGEKE